MASPEPFFAQAAGAFRREVKTPLAFYARALFIVGVAFVALIYLDFPQVAKIALFAACLVIIVGFGGFVSYCVIKCPKNLIFGEESHLVESSLEYGTDSQTFDEAKVSVMKAMRKPEDH